MTRYRFSKRFSNTFIYMPATCRFHGAMLVDFMCRFSTLVGDYTAIVISASDNRGPALDHRFVLIVPALNYRRAKNSRLGFLYVRMLKTTHILEINKDTFLEVRI